MKTPKTNEPRPPPPPSCQRCGVDLPGPDPLRRQAASGQSRSPERQPPAPVKVTRPHPDGEIEVGYWCSSKHYKADHNRADKRSARRPGKPQPHQNIQLRPSAA